MTKWILLAATVCLLSLFLFKADATPPLAPPMPPSIRLQQEADKLFEQKNYAEAAEKYRKALDLVLHDADPKTSHQLSEQLLVCYLRLRDFDKAVQTSQDSIKRLTGKPEEAMARQALGNLYMILPHWGTRSGGEFKRAKSEQGIRLQSHRHDKKLAVEQLTKARELYAQWEGKTDIKDWHVSRIRNLFDLASACAAFGIFDQQPHFWHWYWGQRDDTLAQTADEEDFDENQSYWQYHRKRPIGLLVDASNQPIFPQVPDAWDETLPDDEKALFLLAEIRKLDTTADKQHANRSLYRQAMLAQKRFGMDRMNTYANMYNDGSSQPYRQQLDAIVPWELADNEAVVLAGGQMRKVALPEQWNILGLLDQVQGEQTDQALYARGYYLQGRKQFTKAIQAYDQLITLRPESKLVSAAQTNKVRILHQSISINVPGMQLPQNKAKINVHYRNTDHVWFMARKFDLPGFLKALRQLSFDRKENDHFNVWQLSQWDSLLIHQQGNQSVIHKLVLEYLDDAVISWDQPLKPSEDHRDAQTTIDSPIDTNGTYIVWAWYNQPGAPAQSDPIGQGHARTAMMISDMAIVQKQTTKGNLYFIADSRTGAPLAESKIAILETWNEWNNKTRKTIYHKINHDLVTDTNGFAMFTGQRNRGSQLHVMVENGDRFATNDLNYWNPYNERNTQRSPAVYTLTDRPVYRPGQTVKFKSWVRDFKDGQWVNAPGRPMSITIYDPRGTKLKTLSLTTDDFGGISSQLELGPEAALGQYRIDFQGRYQESAGANFRVEEYKKPEFEVTVKTSESQVKLGEKIKVDIGGRYYFGQPVTHGDVSYKVYRQTYNHKQFLAGPWDWLYGSGYGLSWYESPWFGWWGRGCFVAPDWWYGYYPWWQPSSVRELVMQGEGKLDDEGKLTITIDSADALKQHGDQDHQYIIEAEVRDASRRVINGSGNVLATRQAYFTTIQPTRGYYRSGDQIDVNIICRNPDGSPVHTKGQLIISQVRWTGPDNQTINEVELDRQTLETDASGMATISYRYENAGQLKFHFTSPDSWGSSVEGFGLAWVVGNQFDGKLQRFNDLELITDKRTYKPGQTAHVMINTKQANSYVLLSTDAQNGILKNWRLVHVEGKSAIIDIPVENKHRPNFFIEATTLSSAKLHQQLAQICVPPANSMLDVVIKTDKPTYQPGETANVQITAKDMTGKPVKTQVVLSAFDQSLLYIAGRTSGNMGSYYHGQKNHHGLNSQTNLDKHFTYAGHMDDASQNPYPVPDEWNGIWGPQVDDWRVVDGDEMRERGLLPRSARMVGASGDARLYAADAVNAPAPSAAPMMEMAGADASSMAQSKMKVSDDKSASVVEAESQSEQPVSTRENFADTALWVDAITTNDDGTATTSFTVPDNLTTWQIDSWAMSKTTQVGQGQTQTTATKNLLVRLQTPRFMVQRDQIILTANVHNYLDHETTVMVDLQIPHDVLAFVDRMATQRQVTIEAGGEATINWRVRAMNEGIARIAVTAKGKEESDAMAMTIPVIIHGSLQQQAQTAVVVNGDDDKTIKIELNLPEQIDPKQTELYVSFSPTLIGTMLDALPYLLDYPYGCTEQTISRFVPAVQVRKTLQDMGLSLADIKKNFPAKQIDGKPYHHPWHNSPIFDDKEMDKLIDTGLNRILSMQNGDGGWGWWKGTDSRIYLTTHVLYALQAAQDSGVDIDQNVTRRAVNWLSNAVTQEIADEHWQVNTQTAYAAYVLAINKNTGPWMEKLYEGRDKLNLYGKALLALSLHSLDKIDEAKILLRNIMQYRRDNNETKLTWFEDPDGGRWGGWWYWYNSDIETQAWILRAMTAITPKDEATPQLIKWLLNHREHGYYWRSTRDTALCIDAMSRYVKTSGESDANYTLTLELDGGKVTKTVQINKDNLLTHDNTFVIKGISLPAGKHTLTVRKQGSGALYLNSRLTYFGMQEHIPAYGHELHLKRTYYRLKQIPFTADVDNSKGEPITENRLRYERIELKDGDEVASGEIIQVELNLEADNDYTYLAIEDKKPAGCEPIDVQSGYVRQEGFGTYRELRDQKTMFFIEHIAQGKHLLRYRLRAEVPGVFHALPARVFAMYVPRLDAGSDELIMKITE